ncbi:MAG: hypothetical protein ACJAR1_002855 [Rubritalea sp.]|jgi:hypothetical protein
MKLFKRMNLFKCYKRMTPALAYISILMCSFLIGCSEKKVESAKESPDELIQRMIKSEELILKLSPKLKALGVSMLNGSRENLPSAVASEASKAPWKGLEPTHRWTAASFGTLSAEFKDGNFLMKTKFEGVRQGDDGSIVGVKAEQKMVWTKKADSEDEWILTKWEPLEFETDDSPQTLFEEVLDKVIPDPMARKIARHSYQEEVLRKYFAGEPIVAGKFNVGIPPDIESTYQYTTVSVVDYDGDGNEDLFLSSRWVEPQLFRNLGDGTFEDVTARSGLKGGGFVNFALFADFDNDGDPDALFGRGLGPALYYRNDDGKFTDVTNSATDLGKQYFISSAAVSDVNGDGLLDVYLSTYNPNADFGPDWMDKFLPPEEAKAYREVSKTALPFLNETGMANVLLMNRGEGRLERTGGEIVKIWRKSYQPLWFDADNDGDEDLYVCNDFGPDSFLRNDTPRGAKDPIFVDSFAETFPGGKMAFGMGASVGDYDNDGDLDLFVSNMYSKAGNRIVPAIGKSDLRILVAARGNFLYRNDGGVFNQVAKTDAAETKVGWAFGGQFADFNNDGWLDLYVPSGLYSAPKEAATEVDL